MFSDLGGSVLGLGLVFSDMGMCWGGGVLGLGLEFSELECSALGSGLVFSDLV